MTPGHAHAKPWPSLPQYPNACLDPLRKNRKSWNPRNCCRTQYLPSGQVYLHYECHSWHDLVEFCKIHLLHLIKITLTSEQPFHFCFFSKKERTRHKSSVYPYLFYLQYIQFLQKKKKKKDFSQRLSNSKTQHRLDLRTDACSQHRACRTEGGPSSRSKALGSSRLGPSSEGQQLR